MFMPEFIAVQVKLKVWV